MQAETRFKMKVLNRLKEVENCWIVKIQMVATKGIPDILICVNGLFVAWELKVGKNKATRLQALVLNKIEKAGGVARVVTPENFEDSLMEVMCLSYRKSETSLP